jgi:hypothetical protein
VPLRWCGRSQGRQGAAPLGNEMKVHRLGPWDQCSRVGVFVMCHYADAELAHRAVGAELGSECCSGELHRLAAVDWVLPLEVTLGTDEEAVSQSI